MLPAGHMTASTYHPVPAVSAYHNAPGTVRRDEITQPQYAVAGQYTNPESRHDPEDLISYPGSIAAFGKFCICDFPL